MGTEVSRWDYPTRILFGIGSLRVLPEEVKRLEKKCVLVVADEGIRKVGLVDRVTGVLDGCGITSCIFTGVESNPLEINVEAGVEAYKTGDCDVIVAIGGGAPIDVAKAVRLRVTHTEPFEIYDDARDGGRHVTDNVPPMIAIPTTSGTGSEVSRSTVVTLRATRRKTVICANPLMPSVAILDPQLVVGLPPNVTAATGWDALTHCVEAYVATGDHPLADAISLDGVRLCGKHLVRSVEKGDDLDARAGMMKAAAMGAIAFQKGLGASHALAHPLSNVVGLHHGLANALVLPVVLEFLAEAARDRLAAVAAALGQPGQRADQVAAQLRKRIGLPERLSAVGVKEEHLAKMVPQAFEDASHRTSPRPVTKEDLEKLYRAAM